MALFSMPWTIPAFNAVDSWPWQSSTATPPALDRDITATYYNDNAYAGPPAKMPPEPPKVGRPHRGDRAQVKAARRQRRATH